MSRTSAFFAGRAAAFLLCASLAACAASPSQTPADDGGVVEPVEDGGAEPIEDGGAVLVEDGGVALADGGAPDAGVRPPDAGRDDRVWPTPVFNVKAPSDLQDPTLAVNAYFSPTEDTRGIVLRELDKTRVGSPGTELEFAL